MSREFSAAWQPVKCADCGAGYVCTPVTDYYHRPEVADDERTLTNGVCEGCIATVDGEQLPVIYPSHDN